MFPIKAITYGGEDIRSSSSAIQHKCGAKEFVEVNINNKNRRNTPAVLTTL